MKVLSVVGAGRSGTTILASILGEVDGFASAGELRWLWERGIREQRPCGCGKIPTRCPVWGPVVEGSVRSPTAAPDAVVDEIIDAQHELARIRNLPRVIRAVSGPGGGSRALEIVQDATARACEGFAAVTGADVLVDTSKRPVDAAVLAGLEGVDLYVLHMIRDPRAVVHSWRRAKTFTTAGQTRTMGTRRLASTVRRWTSNALSAEALRRRLPASHWLQLRYEEFGTDPRSAVGRVLAFLGETGETPFIDDHTVLLHPNHIVAGNPSRFTTGEVAIRIDEEWRQAMPKRDQRLVSLLTLPLMIRYGYLPAGPLRR